MHSSVVTKTSGKRMLLQIKKTKKLSRTVGIGEKISPVSNVGRNLYTKWWRDKTECQEKINVLIETINCKF